MASATSATTSIDRNRLLSRSSVRLASFSRVELSNREAHIAVPSPTANPPTTATTKAKTRTGPSDSDFNGGWEMITKEPCQNRRPERRQDDSTEYTEQREQGALREVLPEQPSPAGTEGLANSSLSTPGHGQRQEQIRHVDLGDQKQESDRTHQQDQGRPSLLDQRLGQHRHDCLAVLVGFRMRQRQSVGDLSHFNPSAIHIFAWCQTSYRHNPTRSSIGPRCNRWPGAPIHRSDGDIGSREVPHPRHCAALH